jgi:hypothetical protein
MHESKRMEFMRGPVGTQTWVFVITS